MMKRFVVIVAAGKGVRMGNSLPKQFIPIAGRPLLVHSMETFHRWNADVPQIIVLAEEYKSYWSMLCSEIKGIPPHYVVSGGATRFESVKNSIRFVTENLVSPEDTESSIVGIHDGVRPFVSLETIEACFAEAEKSGAAIPAVPVVDSIRRTDGETSHPVDRTQFVAVQTPQVFRLSLLADAYQQDCNPQFTDDASVVETFGKDVVLVKGNPENIKITTPFDLKIAKSVLEKNETVE